MDGLSQPQSNELSDKDTYSLSRHVGYAPQLDSAGAAEYDQSGAQRVPIMMGQDSAPEHPCIRYP